MTKVALKTRCSRILGRGPHTVGQDDYLFLMSEIFPLHESWALKRGCGVSHIDVRRHGTFNSCGFIIVRTDGSEVDISYRVSLDGRGSVWSRFVRAARTEIQPQAHRWRKSHPAPAPDMQVDHIVAFDKIVRDWLSVVDLNPEEIAVTSQLVGHTDCFLDRSAAVSWQRFHAKHAAFQWLSAAENAAKSNNVIEHDEWLAEYTRERSRMGVA